MTSTLKKIKALTICQPWAELIVSGKKNIENRTWNTKKRGFFAIHSSQKKDKKRFKLCKDLYGIGFDPDKLTYGAILGFAEIVSVLTEAEVTKETEKWYIKGNFGFVLKNIFRLNRPIELKGTLNFWDLEGADLQKCLSQLTSGQIKILERKPLS